MQSNLVRHTSVAFAVSVICSLPSTCLADTIVTFNESSTYSDGTQIIGTVQFNQTTGRFGQQNVTGTFRGQSLQFFSNPVLGYRAGYDSENYNALYFTSGFEIEWSLAIPVGGIFGAPGYSGGPICSIQDPCPGNSYIDQFVGGGIIGTNAVSGFLTLAGPSPVPELSSIWLMLTGIGLSEGVRRRRAAHQAMAPKAGQPIIIQR